jgi:tetratricopeptide (TPR) repeat protein
MHRRAELGRYQFHEPASQFGHELIEHCRVERPIDTGKVDPVGDGYESGELPVGHVGAEKQHRLGPGAYLMNAIDAGTIDHDPLVRLQRIVVVQLIEKCVFAHDPPEIVPDAALTVDTLHKHGRLHEAELAYTAILKRDPSQVDALHRLGLIKKEQGRKTEAHALLTAALARCGDAKPGVADSADLLIKRGEILHALDRYFEAVVSYDRALTLAPDRADCHVNRGFSLYYLDRLQAALASYDRALALAPRDATILFYRAQALRRLDRCEEALADLDQTLTRKPDFAPAYNLRGETLASLTRYNEAAAQFELALKHDPKFMPARLNLGLTRLLRGDFHRGWRDYEFRWSNPRAERREFRAPLWLGKESLVGKTILLHAEQGFGDTIQFARYAPLAAERGAKVILEVQAELKTLMSRMAGVAAVLGQAEERTRESRIDGAPVPLAREQDLPPFDYHCPLLSLPLAFKTDLGTVPARIPYLGADPERAHIWRARLGQRRSPLIGLAWSGNRFHWQDRNRSIALNCLAPLLSQPLSFVSLQKAASETDGRKRMQDSWLACRI